MNYTQATEYLRGTNRAFCKPGTERVSALCAAVGDPQRDLPVIHVAGTNGKGSFCAILSSLLRSGGFRVGVFSSPALCRINECVSVNGEPISDQSFARLVSALQPIADQQTDRPTEFEILTALALLFFREEKCHYVILECGMGGLTDATNIIDRPLLSVITEISVDHRDFLGDTISKIARQKAGIMKENCPALWCGSDPEAEKVIRQTALKKNTFLHTVPRETLKIKKADFSGTVFDFEGQEDLSLSMLGLYQVENAANALTALRLLDVRLNRNQITQGLWNARWPGRFEVVCRDPLVIADGGHNADGVLRTVQSIEAYFPRQKAVFVSGIMRDKEYGSVARCISRVAHRVYTVAPPNPRALPAEEYAEVFRSLGVPASPCETIAQALSLAKKERFPIVFLGSLYQYRGLLEALGRF